MSTTTAAVIAATRFGYGAKPDELRQIGDDPRGWLKDQLKVPVALLPDQGLQPSGQILARALELRRDRRESREATAASGATDATAVMKVAKYYRPIAVEESLARVRQAVSTDAPFIERISQFWTNHFAVSIDKVLVLGLAGSAEREAIRPNVLGHFADLLLAAERHPAMLLYLDNYTSVGPNSRAAVRLSRQHTERKAGINENLAREIMELHTLGVHGGYSQTDVTNFAKVLTGWSLDRDSGIYRFRAELHEPGAKIVLGKRYRENGAAEGEQVLRDFAAKPATARFIATKLVRQFIADDPPPDSVARVARVFMETSGHLPSVYAAVLDEPAAWSEPFTKYKNPADFIYSAFRGLTLPVDNEKQVLGSFEVLGQRNYAPGSPAGWPDRSADWDGPAALLRRIEWSDAVGQRIGSRRNAAQIAPLLFGDALSAVTKQAIARAASGAQAITLLLTSPEFMRR